MVQSQNTSAAIVRKPTETAAPVKSRRARRSGRPGTSQNLRARVTAGITTQVSRDTEQTLPTSRVAHSGPPGQISLMARVSSTTVG